MSKNLGMAYAMKKKNAKAKMAKGGNVEERLNAATEASRLDNGFGKVILKAEGGMVNESAKTERRPMPDERDKDSKMVGRNSGNKSPSNDDWGSDVTVRQAQKPSITRLSQPKIVGSDAFSVRNRDQRDENNDQIDSFYPESDKAQPRQRYNEDGPNRQGPKVPDMERQHKAKRVAYDMASEDQYSQDMADDNMKKTQSPLGRYAEGGSVSPTKTDTKTSTTGNKTKTGGSNPGGASTGGAGTVTITTSGKTPPKAINVSGVGGTTESRNHGGMDPGDEDDDGQTMMARGGRVDMEPSDHGQEMEERNDEAHMIIELTPGEHDEQPAKWRDEMDADASNPNRIDMERQHSNGRMAYADGGMVDEEREIMHHASIAAAIMSKQRAEKEMQSDSDEDEMVMMADGGMVDIASNGAEHPNRYYSRNKEALKENYDSDLMDVSQPEDSNEHGHKLTDEDVNNMSKIEKIMARMSKRSPITK